MPTPLGPSLIAMLLASMAHAMDPADCAKLVSAPEPLSAAAAHAHTDTPEYAKVMDRSEPIKRAFAGVMNLSGLVADFGCGSGSSAAALAVSNPRAHVVGVDFDPAMVELARKAYGHIPNVEFRLGDATQRIFEAGSLNGAFSSSTGHHLTSFGDPKFAVSHVEAFFAQVARALAPGAFFIMRDFVVPENAERPVNLDVRTDDFAADDGLSTAELFLRFAWDFRSSVNPLHSVRYAAQPSGRSGFSRFRATLRTAAEFLLRKDYRKNYRAEVMEEYTYMTQVQMEQAFRALGMQVVASSQIWNPWIVANRWQGQAFLSDPNGNPIEFPPTNVVVIPRKLREGEGSELELVSAEERSTPSFVRVQRMKDRSTGAVVDLSSRPNETYDLLPYYREGNHLHVLVKDGFPRPITKVDDLRAFDGTHSAGYVMEPLAFIHDGERSPMDAIRGELSRRAALPAEHIQETIVGSRMLANPELTDEQIRPVFLRVTPPAEGTLFPTENYSGLSSSGTVRPIEARQALLTAQVGGVMSARLELGIYRILRREGLAPEAWIGDAIKLTDGALPEGFRPARFDALYSEARLSRAFDGVAESAAPSSLRVFEGRFAEKDQQGRVMHEVTRDYVTAAHGQSVLVSVLPVARRDGRTYVGLTMEDSAAQQLRERHSSGLVTQPKVRLPSTVTRVHDAPAHAAREFTARYGAAAGHHWWLGSRYFASPGITPERVYPLAVEVDPATTGPAIRWVPLSEALAHEGQVRDQALLTSLYRLAHALGEL